jgi:hypothetical protein
MTPQSPLMAHIAMAEIHVRDARQAWDPSSLSGCFHCTVHLDRAIGEMKGACEAAAAGPVPPGTKTRLSRLRADVETLSRLVDAAMAFSRGLPLQATLDPMIDSEVRG